MYLKLWRLRLYVALRLTMTKGKRKGISKRERLARKAMLKEVNFLYMNHLDDMYIRGMQPLSYREFTSDMSLT